MTNGASDPTVGEAVRILGYDADFAALPSDRPGPRVVIGRVPGWQGIRLDARASTVTIPRGVSLDLGSIGKAYASDLAAEEAFAAVGGGVLVSLGGDIATAGAAPAGGWRVHCSDDSSTDPASPGEVVSLTEGAIATSSTTVRRWTAGGVQRHHIIDPATSLPAAGPWRTATVAAATCVDANAASTAAIVLGREAPEWLRQAGLAARLVGHDGSVVRVAEWPAPLAAAAPGASAPNASATATSAA
jgi:thiamine biosynthesis lipoprotein